MSIVFKPTTKERPLKFDPNRIQVLVNENALLIKIIVEYQNKGKAHECAKYQDVLNRNLIYLARLSDFEPDEQFLKKTTTPFVPKIEDNIDK